MLISDDLRCYLLRDNKNIKIVKVYKHIQGEFTKTKGK
jgi:hypothetical protein